MATLHRAATWLVVLSRRTAPRCLTLSPSLSNESASSGVVSRDPEAPGHHRYKTDGSYHRQSAYITLSLLLPLFMPPSPQPPVSLSLARSRTCILHRPSQRVGVEPLPTTDRWRSCRSHRLGTSLAAARCRHGS